ncbi:MAG: 4Fe-4S binding protein [Chitinivibrionales bacterium]
MRIFYNYVMNIPHIYLLNPPLPGPGAKREGGYGVFIRKLIKFNRDACIECGACSSNCPADAISVSAGVGCAKGLINTALGLGGDCCCSGECCSE